MDNDLAFRDRRGVDQIPILALKRGNADYRLAFSGEAISHISIAPKGAPQVHLLGIMYMTPVAPNYG